MALNLLLFLYLLLLLSWNTFELAAWLPQDSETLFGNLFHFEAILKSLGDLKKVQENYENIYIDSGSSEHSE